jgi:transcriptional regulator with XRE-family HTH domain
VALAGAVAIIGIVAKRLTDRERVKHEQTIRDRETLGHLGGRIRLLREQRGLSQEKLAERAGLTSKFLGEVERIETNPSTTSIARLAAALSVNVGDLFEAGDHLLPVPTTQLDHVQETYRTLGVAIEGLRTPAAITGNGGPARAVPVAPRHKVSPRKR